MVDLAALDRRIKRLGRTEARYRAMIKGAEADLRRDPDRKAKYQRVIAKTERRMEKLLPRIRRLREIRAREGRRR